MFGFGFALVPLYDIFCEITGLNGKTGVIEEAAIEGTVDTTREVTVEFVANVNSELPWEFRPVTKRMTVHPGQLYDASFVAHNRADKTLVGQAVPSVSPAEASRPRRHAPRRCAL